jgi:hypothetical protein
LVLLSKVGEEDSQLILVFKRVLGVLEYFLQFFADRQLEKVLSFEQNFDLLLENQDV